MLLGLAASTSVGIGYSRGLRSPFLPGSMSATDTARGDSQKWDTHGQSVGSDSGKILGHPRIKGAIFNPVILWSSFHDSFPRPQQWATLLAQLQFEPRSHPFRPNNQQQPINITQPIFWLPIGISFLLRCLLNGTWGNNNDCPWEAFAHHLCEDASAAEHYARRILHRWRPKPRWRFWNRQTLYLLRIRPSFLKLLEMGTVKNLAVLVRSFFRPSPLCLFLNRWMILCLFYHLVRRRLSRDSPNILSRNYQGVGSPQTGRQLKALFAHNCPNILFLRETMSDSHNLERLRVALKF